ncbi:MAG: pilin [Clostridia bacterium]|nr:pilin [Clostridia bacterium]
MRRKVCSVLIIMLVAMFSLCVYSHASSVDQLIPQMANANKLDDSDVNTGIGDALNAIIGIIQFAGSGIAIIVVSILGIRYLFASPSEKADVKKMAFPIIIGCILLFGAVNIAGIIYDFATGAFGN